MTDTYNPKTEDLKHISDLQDFPDPPSTLQEASYPVPPREDILDFGDEGFLLRQVLSPEECSFFKDRGEEIGFQKIAGARESYRNSQR